MLSRRRFLAALAASVASRPFGALAVPRHRVSVPRVDPDWHYGRGYTLAVRTNQRVPDLPPLQLPTFPAPVPPVDAAAIGPPLRRRFPDLRRHFVFEYYPSYGTSPWRHWNQWDRVPPYDIAVTSVPALGPYDSRSAQVIEQHAAWIAASGVGAINISWWGRGSQEDQAVPLIMDVMNDHGLKVTFHLEPYADNRTEQYAADLQYLLTEYGEKRRFDCLLMLRDADGSEAPVFKSFATILPQTSTDCRGNTSPVSLWRPDATWRQQTDTVRETFVRDFDRLHLLADSSALERVRAGGFDGIALYDNYVRPGSWPRIAEDCRAFDLEFSFNINAGFDGIAQRGVPAGSCYAPPRFEPPAAIDWSSALDREEARFLAQHRIDDSFAATLNLQTSTMLPDSGAGFFLVYINSFNEWHEGTAFEPMRNHQDLRPEELPFGYHNPTIGDYRLSYLTSRLSPLLTPA